MEVKEMEVLNEVTGKNVKCVCVNYEKFIADCDEMTMLRYRQFKCNPKNQFEQKADIVITDAIFDERFFPSLFFIRLNKRQTICNCQIDYTFELLDRAFLEKDNIRQNELDKDVLEACLSPEVDYVMIYVGMNR